MNFTKRKFLKLSLSLQHTQASKMVRAIYLHLLYQNRLDTSLFNHYQEIQNWMNLPLIEAQLEELSNRYHFHLSHTKKPIECLPSQLDSPSASPFLPIDIYLDRLRSLHNIGSIIRTTEAFRLGSVYLDKSSFDLNHPQIKKTSMGADSIVPIKPFLSLDNLKKPLIGLEITKTSHSIFHYSFPDSFSLLVGNEEYGLSKQSLNSCDAIVHIPLFGQKNSLNVSCAFAIAAACISQKIKTDFCNKLSFD